MKHRIAIRSLGILSPLGVGLDECLNGYKKGIPAMTPSGLEGFESLPVAPLTTRGREIISSLKEEDSKYRSLDASVLYAIAAARMAWEESGWKTAVSPGVNIGSSRGATGLFETYYDEFRKSGRTSTLSSPTTTLGNIASWVAHDLRTGGPVISHSITCSTALHAVLNAAAWLRSGMSTHFLAGGSEASLTPFTLAQMKALKIYAEGAESTHPCKAGKAQKERNSMVLGEGAAVAALDSVEGGEALAWIDGLGYATESLKHNISISEEALCFQESMRMAIEGRNPDEIDVIVTHTPGTIKGDAAEMTAIRSVFGERKIGITNNKWLVGHTFGASGMISLEMGVQMLRKQVFYPLPWGESPSGAPSAEIRNVLINAVGFGGNAVSVLLSGTELKRSQG